MNAGAFTEWIAAQTIQVTVVFAVVFALDAWVARRGSVMLRSALWAAFFVKLVLPPHLASPVSIARVFAADEGAAGLLIARGAEASLASLAWIVLCTWALGCAACASLAVLRMRAEQRAWSADAQAAGPGLERLLKRLALRSGLKRAPAVRIGNDDRGAASVGLARPIIVVPRALAQRRTARALEHVLLHELAHVRRRDAWRALAWTAARCVYWFHPLVHLAARRAALVRELACDEAAVRAARDGADGYRRTLLALAQPLLGRAPAITGFGGSGAMIVARLERLTGLRAVPGRRFDALAATAFVALCTCCLPLAGVQPTDQPQPALGELDGCLRKRFVVMAAIAHAEAQVQTSTRD